MASPGEEPVKCSRRTSSQIHLDEVGKCRRIFKATRRRLSAGTKHFRKMMWKRENSFSVVWSLLSFSYRNLHFNYFQAAEMVLLFIVRMQLSEFMVYTCKTAPTHQQLTEFAHG